MLLPENHILQHDHKTYQILGKVGSESGFGAVYKALDAQGNMVVVKQMLGRTALAKSDQKDYDYACKTFQREAEILCRHNDPGVVKGLDFFQLNGEMFFVMEFINGDDLDQALIQKMETQHRPFDETETIAIGIEICRIIHCIHQWPGQILYRDLKPRNIMWDAAAKKMKLIDFGTARFMSNSQQATQALGTPGYAPPELYSTDHSLSFAADVYTIGATLYELCTAEPPEPLLTPQTFCGYETELSDPFRQIIQKAMNQAPKSRFQTAQELGFALSKLSKSSKLNLAIKPKNPYPYLSCYCPQCGMAPKSSQSIYCSHCGGTIHVLFLRIHPADPDRLPMDLFLDKSLNQVGRTDLESNIFPDIDLSVYDPDCHVSRKHCTIRREGDQHLLLVESSAKNPTYFRNAILKPGRAVVLKNGDQIKIGALEVSFIIKPCLDS